MFQESAADAFFCFSSPLCGASVLPFSDEASGEEVDFSDGKSVILCQTDFKNPSFLGEAAGSGVDPVDDLGILSSGTEDGHMRRLTLNGQRS